MQVRYGMVHGRFQPFHLGHLQYVLAASRRCDHLIVGVTNPDPSLIVAEATARDRRRPEANLFTFFERQRMIRAALAFNSVPTKSAKLIRRATAVSVQARGHLHRRRILRDKEVGLHRQVKTAVSVFADI